MYVDIVTRSIRSQHSSTPTYATLYINVLSNPAGSWILVAVKISSETRQLLNSGDAKNRGIEYQCQTTYAVRTAGPRLATKMSHLFKSVGQYVIQHEHQISHRPHAAEKTYVIRYPSLTRCSLVAQDAMSGKLLRCRGDPAETRRQGRSIRTCFLLISFLQPKAQFPVFPRLSPLDPVPRHDIARQRHRRHGPG